MRRTQNDDGDMFCVQSAHHVSPGGPGVAGHQRLGRHGPRTGNLIVNALACQRSAHTGATLMTLSIFHVRTHIRIGIRPTPSWRNR